ncbi:MAG: ribonuclease H-like domain-containing protein [Butyribacter sp.]|nr:ribonuclease H-like domain-containing protein [bacterium]MDY3855132.1 ribonuclease H-like domain-containing protein [Butyribacter sp.]
MKKIITSIKQPFYSYTFPSPVEKTAFFDIETTGLSPNASSLYLVGLMYFDTQKKDWQLCQWFADNYHSEKEILEDFLDTLSSFSYLYHFNGKTFDIPYVQKKCKRHAIVIPKVCQNIFEDTSGIYSVDLLSKIRPLRHILSLKKCNQTAVEQWLGIQRTDIFSGGDLIPVYSEYMQQKIISPENAGKLEKTLLLHNHDDIEMMLALCSMLTYDELLSEHCVDRLLSAKQLQQSLSVSISENELLICFTLPVSVPKKVCLTQAYPESQSDTFFLPDAKLTIENTDVSFLIPLYKETLRFFISDYQNYYYLPDEDMAIHKSVASFVDSSHRKKATKATCYQKKNGTFLPSLASKKTFSCECFYKQYNDKLVFVELPNEPEKEIAFWQEFLKMQLPTFRKKQKQR